MFDIVRIGTTPCRYIIGALLGAACLSVASMVPAHGLPPVPLAPTACEQYGFNGTLSIKQDNGLRVDIAGWSGLTAPTTTSPAQLFLSDGTPALIKDGIPVQHSGEWGDFATPETGAVHGGIEGNKLSFVVDWGPLNVPVSNDYEGTINDGGQGASGVTTNTQGASNKWNTFASFDCVRRAAPPAPVAVPAPVDTKPVFCTATGQTLPPGSTCPVAGPAPGSQSPYIVKITGGAVDIYAQPGGVGKPFSSLPEGTDVHVLERRPDNWVHVQEEVNNKLAEGWVWGDYVPQT